ncbi:unnamed protein product [Chrysoparadoxa australica]
MAASARPTWPLATAMATNVLSVVGVVGFNKYLWSKDGFNYPVFLSALHYLFSSIGTRLLLRCGVINYMPIPWRQTISLAMGVLGSVGFMNLNLAANSVGFYQLSKLACIPVTVWLEQAFFCKRVSQRVKLTLIPLLIGGCLATVYDVSLNLRGSAYALAAILCTVHVQIVSSRAYNQIGCNPLQLLLHVAPVVAAGMLLFALFFDDLPALARHEVGSGTAYRILGSCCLAFVVQLSNFLVLGKTSALTYQVLGHLKTICILGLGFTVFGSPIMAKQMTGIAITLVGAVLYSEAKRAEAAGTAVSSLPPGKTKARKAGPHH